MQIRRLEAEAQQRIQELEVANRKLEAAETKLASKSREALE